MKDREKDPSRDCKPLDPDDLSAANYSPWYPLFQHMSDQYEMTLLDGELSEIALKADESRMKAKGRSDMVRWALVNALIHLDTEQLHALGEAIAKRSGGTYRDRPS